MSKLLSAAGLLLVATMLSGCQGDSKEGASPSSGKCTPEGTELKFGLSVDPSGFDVVNGGTVGIAGGNERMAVFDTLMEYDTKKKEFIPRMAESFEPNADFTEWTLKLRDGMTFGSGNPVTTEAVQFSVERHGAEKTVSLYNAQMDNIAKMNIVSPLEMVFELDAPRGDLPAVFASAPGMLAEPAVFKEMGAKAFGLNPGKGAAGPYTVESYTPGEAVVLKRRDAYWGKANADFCVGTINISYIGQEEARRDAFLNGEVDMAFFQNVSIIEELRQEDREMFTWANWGDMTALINHGTGGVERPGSDLRVRKAIAYALDPELINKRALGGNGIASNALVTKRSVLWSEGLEGPKFDPAEARKQLDLAKADGYDGKITLACDNAQSKVDWSIAVEAMLEDVGFEVDLDNGRSPIEHVVNKFYPGDYDLACFPMSMDEAQPWATFQTLLGQDPVTQGRVGYKSEKMAAAMTELRGAGTTEDRQAAIVKMQEVWNEEIPMAITVHGERGAAWNDNVSGLRFMNTAIAMFDDVRVSE